jgi:uncharacterized protein (DUF2141 family)
MAAIPARAHPNGQWPRLRTHAIVIKIAANVSFMQRSRGWITLSILGFLLAGPAWSAAPAANLTIRVENVLPSGGVLRLGLYDAARYPDDNSRPIASADVPAVAGETVITLHNIPLGVYAIQTFQDVNANDRMDTSWLGLPLEPFGFSRDATPFLSKPSFDEVKFTLTAGENSQDIHLQTMTRNSPTNKAREAVRARQRK